MAVSQGFSPMVERAVRLAAVAHVDQMRKGTRIPYVTHLMQVVILLQRHGFHDDATIAAALLHDVVEDTSVTPEELAREFPEEVCALLAQLTERKRDSQGAPRPWEVRKQEHLEQMRVASQRVRAITLADKLHNMATILYDLEQDPTVWTRFNASPDRILAYHASMIDVCASDDPELHTLAEECRSVWRELAGRAPSRASG